MEDLSLAKVLSERNCTHYTLYTLYTMVVPYGNTKGHVSSEQKICLPILQQSLLSLPSGQLWSHPKRSPSSPLPNCYMGWKEPPGNSSVRQAMSLSHYEEKHLPFALRHLSSEFRVLKWCPPFVPSVALTRAIRSILTEADGIGIGIGTGTGEPCSVLVEPKQLKRLHGYKAEQLLCFLWSFWNLSGAQASLFRRSQYSWTPSCFDFPHYLR